MAAPAEAEVWVLGDAPTVRGFRLAGLAGAIVEGASDARAALARARAHGAALVLVTETLAEALGGPEALVGHGLRPLLVVVPSASVPGPSPGFAEQLAQGVQRALGLSGRV
jgi:vacuolar-type H+-ATPase subunit F/Vma7